MSSYPRFLLCIALAATTAVGCGAASSFDGRVLSKPETRYRVGALAADWERLNLEGNDLAFYSEGKGTIGVNASCDDYDDVPPRALMNHLFFGTTRRRFRVDEEVTLDGRGTRHVVLDADLDGTPVQVEVFLQVHAGCVYDITHTRGRDAADAVRQEFLAFVEQFSVLQRAPR